MTLIRVDDMYNVSLLSWMGNPDIFYFDPKIYDIGNARCIVGLFWLVFRMQFVKEDTSRNLTCTILLI